VRRLEAEIILEYGDAKFAEAVAKAISPDNFKVPKGLSIKTMRKANKVFTKIRNKGEFPTFISTIDDLLFCASTAEKAIKVAKRLQ